MKTTKWFTVLSPTFLASTRSSTRFLLTLPITNRELRQWIHLKVTIDPEENTVLNFGGHVAEASISTKCHYFVNWTPASPMEIDNVNATLDDKQDTDHSWIYSALASYEMGFSRSRAEEALWQVGSNSVDLAMEWLFSHPEDIPEDDELARALAMSLGNSEPDMKDAAANDTA